MVELNDFERACNCIYNDEHYTVRDNGAVLRNSRENEHTRPTDNKWTFGKLNRKTGYLEIASVRVHRIVATGFHGEPPSKEHVVDHIDTNKQNNRPENLRWVTRLENVLLNPITLKRIEIACGCRIEEFLDNPSKFRDKFKEPNNRWMCTVSIEEAQKSKEKLLAWAESDKLSAGGSLGEWIYSRNLPKTVVDITPEFTTSLTQNAVQKNWTTPTEFPCCPQDKSLFSIANYAANLNVGNPFSKNHYFNSIIEDFAISKDESTLWVMCKNVEPNAIKPYLLAEIKIENNKFVHNNLGSFFKNDGAKKQFTLLQGLEWTEGDTFDDFC
ncbi:MAG: HNH endonuclease signature motif containing protein [Sphingobacteriales bacterium]|nr:HNH endonuclease signature motif containing protein [Sphingobacteriales bacterium]